MSLDLTQTRPDDEQLVDITAAAEYLGLKVKTLYEWRRLRKGPVATKVGRLVKYRLGDLRTYVAAQRETRVQNDAA